MKQFVLSILIIISFVSVYAQSPIIAVNQIGYLNNATKNAWVCGLNASGQKWYVKNKMSNTIVFTSTIKTPGSYDEACQQNVLMLDFSSVHDDGVYYIEVEGVAKSFPFEISNYCLNNVFKAGVKSYYYQRSGMELAPEYAGIWAKPASHTADGYLYAGYQDSKIIKGDYRKCTGGWYDAGDFGKKIVPASIAMYPFMKLAEFYPEIVEGSHIDIPNKNKELPDLLAEAKWELDWFFTMQENNGAVHHLIVTPEFYMGPAQNDPQTRYILTVSTAATADYAAIMALASKVYRKYLPAYADSCLAAAEKAWGFLKQTPDIYPKGGYSDPAGINGTGAYGDSNDKDERLWAASELFAATSKTEYRRFFENNYSDFSIAAAGGWQFTSNYAFYTWIQATAKEPGNAISNSVKSRILSWADGVESSSMKRGFGVSLDKNSYFWGSNSNVLNVGMEMLIIDQLFKTEKYSTVALNQLNYILGCNSLNLCFLSGYGSNGVKDPHQCINSYDQLAEAPPGFIPGGPNSYIDKWDLGLYNYVTQNNFPPAKCYLDNHASFSSNEVCVCYNSGLVFLSGFFYQLKPVYSKSPIMGWASWNNFFVDISDPVIKGQADAMVSSGLAAAGYRYINIDDGFFDGRYSDGTLKINSVKFPNGMKSLVDYIHSKGLKAGFYSEAGANTCGSQYNGQTGGVGGGMYNHDQQDANLFFKTWGFDFLKVDYCGGLVQKLDEKERYTAIKTAIYNTGRTDVNYNVCRWQFPGSWVTKIADSWRISQDISFDKFVKWDRVLYVIDCNTFLAAYSSQGHYNDMDMMEVGRGLTAEEDKSHFSLWCILSAPLVLGNDLTSITKQTKDILTNLEVIAVDQDTTGVQGKLVSDNGAGLQVWAKNLNGKQSKERAVVLFNRSAVAAPMTVKWKDLNLVGPATVRNLWSHSDLGNLDSTYTATVPSHGVIMLKVVGEQIKLQEVFEAEYAWINNFNLTKNSVIIADQGRVVSDASCSGRAKASWLGNRADNYIEFHDVYAKTAGRYRLTISYISGENRNATLTVNGKDTLLSKLNSGGWSTLSKSTFNIKLNQGNNTIRFSNATGWLPDFDKIQLDLNKVDPSVSSVREFPSLPIKVYPNPCNSFLQIDSELPIKRADLYSLTGCLLKQYGESNISVCNLSPGTYLLEVQTDKGKDTRLIIKR